MKVTSYENNRTKSLKRGNHEAEEAVFKKVTMIACPFFFDTCNVDTLTIGKFTKKCNYLPKAKKKISFIVMFQRGKKKKTITFRSTENEVSLDVPLLMVLLQFCTCRSSTERSINSSHSSWMDRLPVQVGGV